MLATAAQLIPQDVDTNVDCSSGALSQVFTKADSF
jgi:hypothetical protein